MHVVFSFAQKRGVERNSLTRKPRQLSSNYNQAMQKSIPATRTLTAAHRNPGCMLAAWLLHCMALFVIPRSLHVTMEQPSPPRARMVILSNHTGGELPLPSRVRLWEGSVVKNLCGACH
jgi:hypothetical protein